MSAWDLGDGEFRNGAVEAALAIFVHRPGHELRHAIPLTSSKGAPEDLTILARIPGARESLWPAALHRPLPNVSRNRKCRIRIAGTDYLVTDTGTAIKGRHIDLYLNSVAEAKQFGTKTVRVEVRQWGTGKADARAAKTGPAPRRQ